MRPPLDDSRNRYLIITCGVLDKVTGYKKKSALFLITALLIGAIFVVCLEKSTADEKKIMDPKFKAGFLLAGDPNSSAAANNGFGNRELFFKTMSMVVLVSVLGVAAIYASKKLLPKITLK